MKAWIGRNWTNWTVFPLLMLLVTVFVYTNGCQPAQDAAVVTVEAATNPLVEPNVISAAGGVLNTSLVVRLQNWCQGSLGMSQGLCSSSGTNMTLRTYGTAKDQSQIWNTNYLSNDANLNWTIPGPTFNVSHGDRLLIRLFNNMPANTVEGCNPTDPPENTPPNCFHGDNVTNFHFHGFRVSPNEPQDYIYLKLEPGDFYQFNVDPLTEIQAPGTHWYHPHKHGSTALQVLNGMAGTFIVSGGDIDRALAEYEQQVLVIQQIKDKLNPFKGTGPGGFFVNAQTNPTITMKSGEVQRWRFVGAMMQGSAHSTINFANVTRAMALSGEAPRVRQVAQDGVQFADANYQNEVLDHSSAAASLRKFLVHGIEPSAEELQLLEEQRQLKGSLSGEELETAKAAVVKKLQDLRDQKPQEFLLAPGNRMDFLVKAPIVSEGYEDFPLVVTRTETLAPGATLEQSHRDTLDAISRGNEQILLTLRVVSEQKPMDFPANLPPLPWYLEDIDPAAKTEDVVFSMTGNQGGGPDASGQPPNFYIDGEQYNTTRIDHEVTIGINETWNLKNTSGIAHPFHIHVNPFQITNLNGEEQPKPWVWWDTVALPIFNASGDGTNGTVNIRQRFLEFTGEYVLHCHILGHEDRGMMQNVRCSDP